MPKRCDFCGKRHWFKVPPRYWLKVYWDNRGSEFPYQVLYTGPDGRIHGTVATNYHESAGKVYCHGCWAPFLASIGE